MARSAVFNKVQLGKEVTPGTGVAANKQMTGMRARLRPRYGGEGFRPGGSRFDNDFSIQKGIAEGSFEGRLNLGGDICYILNSLVKSVTPTGAGPYVWTYLWDPDSENTIQTYTIETGGAGGAEKTAFGRFSGLDMRFTRSEASMNGSIMGALYEQGATITPTPTKVAKALALFGKVKVEVADSIGALARLTRVLELSTSIRDVINPLMTLDESVAGATDWITRPPGLSARLVLENDSVGAGMMADLKASTQKFLRFTAYGPEISAGVPYYLECTMPFKFADADTGDQDDVDTGIFDLHPVTDTGLASAVKFVVQNSLSAL